MAKKFTLQDKEALLKQGEPFVVHPREVAKVFPPECGTSPAIILGCILVSGTLDTSQVLMSEVKVSLGLALDKDEQRARDAFRRVWAAPTEDERAAVMEMAEKVAAAVRSRKPLVWGDPT